MWMPVKLCRSLIHDLWKCSFVTSAVLAAGPSYISTQWLNSTKHRENKQLTFTALAWNIIFYHWTAQNHGFSLQSEWRAISHAFVPLKSGTLYCMPPALLPGCMALLSPFCMPVTLPRSKRAFRTITLVMVIVKGNDGNTKQIRGKQLIRLVNKQETNAGRIDEVFFFFDYETKSNPQLWCD